MLAKALTDAQKDEIQRRFGAGESKSDIARAMNLGVNCIGHHTPKVRVKVSITEEQIREIVSLVQNGKSKAAVARKLGVARTTVNRHTNHIRLASPETPPEKKTEVVRRALAGDAISAIARDLDINPSVTYRIAQHALHDYELSDSQKSAIQAAWDEGKSSSQIASKLTIPLMIVNQILGIYSGNRYPDEMRESIIRAIESGESSTIVAGRYDLPHQTACEWFNAAVARGAARRPDKLPGKDDDLQFSWITRLDPELGEWRELIVGWFETEKLSFNTARLAVTAFIERYLISANLPKKPADLLQRPQNSGLLLPDFYETGCPKGPSGRRYNAKIYEFIEWVLDSPGFADTDGGEPIRFTELYRNPIDPNAGNGDMGIRNTESTKVVLPYFLVADIRKRIAQGPDFKDWKWVQGLSGYETINGQVKGGDWFPVTEDKIDRDDPDCVWRLRPRVKGSSVLEMWSPVRWVHALVHLQTTTRSGQLRMVDSGEADTFIWQGGQFIPNPGPLRQGSARKQRQQGIFRCPSAEEAVQGVKVSLYFNTNKTADRGKVGAAKGFECPWPQMPNIEEDPYYWLAKLRDFQMKYNSIDALTPWRELKGAAKLSAKTNEQTAEYPDTAFLFRTPENIDHPNWPIGSGECYLAWQKLLAAYEKTLADECIRHPSGEPIELINPMRGTAWSSPHATRVSLITHLILDGDVPPVIMMKIAGHARFIMTIYYTKVGLAGIQSAIKVGSEKIEASKYQTFERDLLGTQTERMREKVVFNAEEWQAVLPANTADRNPLGWLHMHDGICLAGGNTGSDFSAPGCHNGGAAIIAETVAKKARYGPVPGGVRNCCRCRWKAAGKQHLIGLAATYDNRAFHMHKAKDDAIASERERNRLMQDKARVESDNAPYTRIRDLIDAERRHETAMQKFQELAQDVATLHRTIERVMALPDNTDGPSTLAAQGDLITVNMIIEDTNSKLLQLATICADVEFFPDLDSGTAIFEFSQLLDHAFEREGQPMVLARLSEREKLAAANAIMRELERQAHPENSFLGRRIVVEILDRGESLEKILGVKLKDVLQLANHDGYKPVPLRLFQKEMEGIK